MLEAGNRIAFRELESVTGERVPVPGDGLTHLQFRRFAGCPICNLHLRSVARRNDELAAAGIREIAVFHSPADELRPYSGELPFPVIADPRKSLYREFGVESAPRALLDPRAWPAIATGVAYELVQVVRRRRPAPPPAQGGRLGLPGDFLIAADGRLLEVKYGAHADDQWPVDEILAYAAAATSEPAPGTQWA